MSDETLRPLERLEEFFKGEAEKHGATVVQFLVSPSRREVTVLLDLEDELFLDDETRQVRDEFEEIEKNFAVERKEERAAEAVRDLSDLERKLADPDEGIL